MRSTGYNSESTGCNSESIINKCSNLYMICYLLKVTKG